MNNIEKLKITYTDINGMKHTASMEGCPVLVDEAIEFCTKALRLVGFCIEEQEDE